MPDDETIKVWRKMSRPHLKSHFPGGRGVVAQRWKAAAPVRVETTLCGIRMTEGFSMEISPQMMMKDWRAFCCKCLEIPKAAELAQVARNLRKLIPPPKSPQPVFETIYESEDV